jgi:hypothetical protein
MMTALLMYLQVIEYQTQLKPPRFEGCRFTYQAALFTSPAQNGGVV